MRVYLQPRPAPAAPVAEPPRTNGHGEPAKAEAEASPFRELLTEFRNLTERYGQALLALGEARGEVASLRSRVDVLEARMDLRLPFGGIGTAPPSPAPPSMTPRREPAAQVATPPPPASAPVEPRAAPPEEAPAPEAEREGDSEHESEAEHEPEGDRSARRRRTRAQFVEDFAEALARAEDPNPAELPGSVEAGAAFAALQAVVAPDSEIAQVDVTAADAGMPRELPAAEPMIDTETELAPAPEPAPELPAEPEAEPEPEWPAEPEPQPDVPVETPAARDDDPRVEAEAPATAEPDRKPDPQSASPVEPESSGLGEPSIEIAPEATPSEPSPSWDRDRYTTVIEEPDWWTPDAAGWDDPLPDPASVPVAADPSTVARVTEPDDGPATDEGADAEADPEAEDEPQAAETETAQPITEQPEAPAPDAPDFAASMGLDAPLESEDAATEETMLWFGSRPDARAVDDAAAQDAAAEMEIASTGRQSMPGNDRSTGLPGAGELDDALAALAAHSGTPPEAGPSQADSEPSPLEPSAPRPAAPAPRVERVRPVDLPSPASRAYRRLRRIFPN